MSNSIGIPVESLPGYPNPFNVPPRTEKWELTELYCPSCGKQEVWVEDSDGDYYEGPPHLCVGCETKFTLPFISQVEDQDDNAMPVDQQRLAGIREHIKKNPK